MYTLVIGNRNYSSWSMRPWLLMKQFGIPFTEKYIPLYVDGYKEAVVKASPSGKVPCLIDGEIAVWDSLAIAEYLAERHSGMWPADPTARAVARAVSAEMHSGFSALRSNYCMNIRRRAPRPITDSAIQADVDRITAIWNDCRVRFGNRAGGPFLFGAYSIADAMYAPVCFRFQTYGIKLGGAAGEYLAAMLVAPSMQELAQAAAREVETIAMYESL
jgi:glutathione S-transferase